MRNIFAINYFFIGGYSYHKSKLPLQQRVPSHKFEFLPSLTLFTTTLLCFSALITMPITARRPSRRAAINAKERIKSDLETFDQKSDQKEPNFKSKKASRAAAVKKAPKPAPTKPKPRKTKKRKPADEFVFEPDESFESNESSKTEATQDMNFDFSSEKSSDDDSMDDDSLMSFMGKENKSPSMSELHRAEREKRRSMREIHSGNPMRLSRRLSYRLSDPNLSPLSPAFSPITAIKLEFTPVSSSTKASKNAKKSRSDSRRKYRKQC